MTTRSPRTQNQATSLLIRGGPVPVPDIDILRNDPILGPAYARLEELLDMVVDDAEQLQQYLGARSYSDYMDKVLDAVPYMTGNKIIVTGPPGSGKSTLLATYFYHAKHRFSEATAPFSHKRPPRGRRLDVPLGIIDPTVIPDNDSAATRLAALASKLAVELKDKIEKWSTREMESILNSLDESIQDLEKSIYLLDVNHEEILGALVSSLDEYVEEASYVLNSGYMLIRNYMKFSEALRRAAATLAGVASPEKTLITLGIDDLDVSSPKRVSEIIILCKLLSLDPYTVCIVALQSPRRIARALAAYLSSRTGGSEQDGAYTAQLLLSKLLPRTAEIRLAPMALGEKQLHDFVPISERVPGKEPKKLIELAKEARLGNTTVAEYLLTRKLNKDANKLGIAGYPIYARLFRTPRCATYLYNVLRDWSGEDSLHSLVSVVSSCAQQLHPSGLQDPGAEELLEQLLPAEPYMEPSMYKPGILYYVEPGAVVEVAHPGSITVAMRIHGQEFTGDSAIAAAVAAELLSLGGSLEGGLGPCRCGPGLRVKTRNQVVALPSPMYRVLDSYALFLEAAAVAAERMQGMATCSTAEARTSRLLTAYMLAGLEAAVPGELPSRLMLDLVEGSIGDDEFSRIADFIKNQLGIDLKTCSYEQEAGGYSTATAASSLRGAMHDLVGKIAEHARGLLTRLEGIEKQRGLERWNAELWLRLLASSLAEVAAPIPWASRVYMTWLVEEILG